MTVIAHVGGLPVEEMLGMYGPALLLVLGAATARARSGRDSDRAARETGRGA